MTDSGTLSSGGNSASAINDDPITGTPLSTISRLLKIKSDTNTYTEFGSISEITSSRTLGTFAGVFGPVSLSMFSALLFLRVGFVVGNAGLYETLAQFAIAYAIIFFTIASVCAVSTNGEVEGGGAYFMISRTLGPEFGGSIGTLFFLANVVSSALYNAGFAEALINNFGPTGYLVGGKTEGILSSGPYWSFFYASMLNLANLVVCLIGANMFAKTTMFVFIIVVISIASSFISFFCQSTMQVEIPEVNRIIIQNATHRVFANYTGLSLETLKGNLFSNYSVDYTNKEHVYFSSVFGVLFTGVTGVMAGVNMSGELKDPSHNIPKGTISAVIFTMIVYITLAVFSAASCDRFLMQNDYFYLMNINIWPPFIAIGVLTVTFSASLSTLIGSSRVIESLAKDNIYGCALNYIKDGVWKSNPLAAVFTSWILVQAMLLIGSLNAIAQINSTLFLLSYFALNLACLGLELASAPNFRPSFNYFTWHTAAAGLVGCFVMMFVINPLYASTSIFLCLLIVLFLHLFSPARTVAWGSISQALIFHQVRKYLLLLDSRKDHVKFWRPQMLLMVGNPQGCRPMITFANDLKKSGLYVLGHVKVKSQYLEFKEDPLAKEYIDWLALVDVFKVKAFVEITVASSVREGLHHMIRLSGMGAMKPNTILFGFYNDGHLQNYLIEEDFERDGRLELRKEHEEKAISPDEYMRMIQDVLKMGKNLCVCRNFHALDKSELSKGGRFKMVDVWPVNFFNPNVYDAFDTTSEFMLQLACILTMVSDWKNLCIRVFLGGNRRSFSSESAANTHCENYKTLLHSLRIKAHIQTFEIPENPQENLTPYLITVNELIKQHSAETAVLFLYLPPLNQRTEGWISNQDYLHHLITLTQDIRPVVMVQGVSAVTSTAL